MTPEDRSMLMDLILKVKLLKIENDYLLQELSKLKPRIYVVEEKIRLLEHRTELSKK